MVKPFSYNCKSRNVSGTPLSTVVFTLVVFCCLDGFTRWAYSGYARTSQVCSREVKVLIRSA